MSFPPPIKRQSGMINIRNALASDANPLDSYKDAKYHKPYHQEIVMGWDGANFVKCKYDSIRKMWISQDDSNILEIQMWNIKK